MQLYWPGTSHPAYDKIAVDWARVGEQLLLPFSTPPMPLADYTSETWPITDHLRVHVLVRKRFAGPAPFVGDPTNPALYVWHVLIDELGRGIAGEAELLYRDGLTPR